MGRLNGSLSPFTRAFAFTSKTWEKTGLNANVFLQACSERHMSCVLSNISAFWRPNTVWHTKEFACCCEISQPPTPLTMQQHSWNFASHLIHCVKCGLILAINQRKRITIISCKYSLHHCSPLWEGAQLLRPVHCHCHQEIQNEVRHSLDIQPSRAAILNSLCSASQNSTCHHIAISTAKTHSIKQKH